MNPPPKKKWPKTLIYSPKYENIAESGHTGCGPPNAV